MVVNKKCTHPVLESKLTDGMLSKVCTRCEEVILVAKLNIPISAAVEPEGFGERDFFAEADNEVKCKLVPE